VSRSRRRGHALARAYKADWRHSPSDTLPAVLSQSRPRWQLSAPGGLSASNGPGLLPFCLGNCIPHVGVAKILIMEMLYGNAGDAEFQHLLGDFRAESRSQLVVVS
jgi:hypothetical protein